MSVVPPMTTTYIQDPNRFSPQRPRRHTTHSGPAPQSYYGNTSFDGLPPRVLDDDLNPVSVALVKEELGRSQRQYKYAMTTNDAADNHQLSPSALRATVRLRPISADTYKSSQQQKLRSLVPGSSKQPRMNPNTRTSAGFTLAQTAQEQEETRARREEDERMRNSIVEETIRAINEKKAEQWMLPTQKLKLQQQQKEQQQASTAATRQHDDAEEKQQVSEVEAPPGATAVTRPAARPRPQSCMTRPRSGLLRPLVATAAQDTEPCAPEGSAERAEQKRRVNPLLDPYYSARLDAAGLGYGRTHKNHGKYLSQWSGEDTKGMSAEEVQRAVDRIGLYRSKDGRGYRREVASLGWGHIHPLYNSYVSVRRPEDVLKDYPDRKACGRFFPSSRTFEE